MSTPIDPRRIVANGYDKIALRFQEWGANLRIEERDRYIQVLLDHATRGMPLLDLGCGNGLPFTKQLAERYRVTAVDISPVQAKLAARTVPRAQVICGDMSNMHFPPESFDAISAFYSLIHLPREELGDFLGRMTRWLRPNGLFVGCFIAHDMPGDIDDWLGAPMYWSGYDSQRNRELLRAAGLTIHSAVEEHADEDGQDVVFLWVIAERTAI
jgi:cyclopropane fatty-acyl-phospholipid synthase-like methyltransferase